MEPTGALSNRMPRGRLWASLKVLVPVAVVLLLFAYVLVLGPGSHPRTSGKATLAGTPSPTTPRFSPITTIADAWGPHAAAATLTTQIDAAHYLVGSALTPDGHQLIGYEVTLTGGVISQTIPAQAGLLNIATRRFTPIGVWSLPKCPGNSCQDTPPIFPLNCCETDGRFFVAQNGYPEYSNPACVGGCVWSYDQTTGGLYEVAAGASYQGIWPFQVDHGLLVLTSGEGIKIADLTARTLSTLPGTSGNSQLFAYRWPYILYATPQHVSVSSPFLLQAYDVATHTGATLPSVNSDVFTVIGDSLFYTVGTSATGPSGAAGATLYELDHLLSANARPHALARFPGDMPVFVAVAGDTLFYATIAGLVNGSPQSSCFVAGCPTRPTPSPAPPAITTLYEVDHYRSSGATARAIAVHAGALGGPISVNARLVVFLSGAAWDRAEGRFVALVSPEELAANQGPRVAVVGNDLELSQPASNAWLAPEQVTIYDMTSLPVLSGP